MSKKETIDVFFTLSPHRKDTSLYSWNRLFFEAPSRSKHRSKHAVLYHTRDEKDVKNIKDLLREQYVKVFVIKLPEKITSSLKEYEQIVIDDYLFLFKEYQPKRIFLSHTKIFPGVETTYDNSKKLTSELYKEGYLEQPEWKHLISETFVTMSIINELICNNLILLHYLISDPVEVDAETYVFNEDVSKFIRRHFVHPLIARSNVYRNTSMLSYLKKRKNLSRVEIVEEQKKKDFVFGLTAYDEQRKNFLLDLLKVHENDDKYSVYYCYFDDNKNLIDTRLKYEEYINEIELSKTTLVIPSYDVTTFSVHRFVESVYMGCIPIVFDSDFVTGFVGYPELTLLIEEKLLIESLDRLDEKIQFISKNYCKLLNELLHTDFFEELNNQSYQQEQINVMFK